MTSERPLLTISDEGGIRTLVIDNPPVNALGHAVRVALRDALLAADADPGVEAVVLATAGRNFIGGADIREFGKPPLSPRIYDVVDMVEGARKPVVAAIKGHALGGGLELALGCHWRVATPEASIGFPEVKLGLIPGAGGTQRAPRLAGVGKAIEMITAGHPISGREAAAAGLVDELADGDVLAAARLFARKVAGGEPRRARDLPFPPGDTAAAFADARAAVSKRARGQPAPLAAIEAIEAGSGDFEQGIAAERRLFQQLLEGPQSKALRYTFFAERAAAQVPDVPADVVAEDVRSVAVLGAGTMGRGIAIAFLSAGFSVRLVEPVGSVLDAGGATVRTTLEQNAARGRLSATDLAAALGRFETVEGGAGAIGEADLVIEAALEDLDLKRQIFAELDRHAPPRAILATNTSTLDVDAIAAATGRPERVLGLHFFSPANIMKLLEVVRGRRTSPPVLATALKIAKRIGKVPVVVGVCDGFVGNRMLAKRQVAAERLLLEGALPAEVDAAWVGFGFPMGPFAMTDLAGVDTNWRVRKARGAPLAIHDAVYEAGRYGQKNGRGFYRYEAGDRKPLPDPAVEALILAASRAAGVTRRAVGAEEIVERLLFPMINEGARILEEGIAARASDIDVVWINGYGWPAWRGGPMYHADTIGLDYLRKRLDEMHAAMGDPVLVPAASLARLAAAGGAFTR